jgi:hypothetical protein
VLPRWTATEIRWRKNVVDRGLCTTAEIRRPTDYSDEIHGMRAPHSGCLYCRRNEVDAWCANIFSSSSLLLTPLPITPECCWPAHVTVRMCLGRWHPRRDTDLSSTVPGLHHPDVFHPACPCWWRHDTTGRWLGCVESGGRSLYDKTGHDAHQVWPSCYSHSSVSQLLYRVRQGSVLGSLLYTRLLLLALVPLIFLRIFFWKKNWKLIAFALLFLFSPTLTLDWYLWYRFCMTFSMALSFRINWCSLHACLFMFVLLLQGFNNKLSLIYWTFTSTINQLHFTLLFILASYHIISLFQFFHHRIYFIFYGAKC